ncbi:phosphatase PAP2 family protein [Aureimonas sp. SK2]|uniref:phosphatase PAP2 family protein n=1 Tax=Aureimonas sp. SK2 TaxID=3015992 RepID=UPI00244484BE|nr:phosphatase PAP2 family protein [Aureimonas sp. SK2]
MNALDQTLFSAINAGSLDWGATAWVAYAAARYIVLLIPLHVAILWIAGTHDVRRQALALVAALVIAIGISFLIGAVVPSQRPFLIPIGNQLIEHRASPSFPSNHGLVMFTYAAVMLSLRHWRHAACIGCASVFVAWSRVYLGIHFPLDMVGALVVAVVAAWGARAFDRRFGLEVTRRVEAMFDRTVVRPANWMIRKQG